MLKFLEKSRNIAAIFFREQALLVNVYQSLSFPEDKDQRLKTKRKT